MHRTPTVADLRARAEQIRVRTRPVPDPPHAGRRTRWRCDACCCCEITWAGQLPDQWRRCRHIINPRFGGRRCPGHLIPVTKEHA